MSKFFHASFMVSLLALMNSSLGQSFSDDPTKTINEELPQQAARLFTIDEINAMSARKEATNVAQMRDTDSTISHKLSFEELMARAKESGKAAASDGIDIHAIAAEKSVQASQIGGLMGAVTGFFSGGSNMPSIEDSYTQAQMEAQYMLQSGDFSAYSSLMQQNAGLLQLIEQKANQK